MCTALGHYAQFVFHRFGLACLSLPAQGRPISKSFSKLYSDLQYTSLPPSPLHNRVNENDRDQVATLKAYPGTCLISRTSVCPRGTAGKCWPSVRSFVRQIATLRRTNRRRSRGSAGLNKETCETGSFGRTYVVLDTEWVGGVCESA